MEAFINTSYHNNTRVKMHADFAFYLLPSMVIVPPLGLPANTLVLRLLLGKPGICSTSDIFQFNLALVNMLFCVTLLTEYIYFLWRPSIEAARFAAWALTQTGGPMLFCIISLDSYMAVCHPLVFLQFKDPKLRPSLCVVVNAISFFSCYLIKASYIFKWKMIMVYMIVALLIISICNILILRSLCQSGPSRKEVHPIKKRALKIVLTAFLQVNFHYVPLVIDYLLREANVTIKPVTITTAICYFALSLESFVQPLSFLVRTKQLPGMKCCQGSTAEDKTVTIFQRRQDLENKDKKDLACNLDFGKGKHLASV